MGEVYVMEPVSGKLDDKDPADEDLGPEDVARVRIRWRQRQITNAAIELFTRSSYHKVSMQEIADQAQVSVGLIYQYFTSKEQLLLHVTTDILEGYRRSVPKAIAEGSGPVEQLSLAYESYGRVVDRNRAAGVLAYSDSRALSTEGREILKELEVSTTALFARVIDQGIRDGIFRKVDTMLAAYNLVFTIHMWGLKHWYFASRIEFASYIEQQFRWQLRALARDPKTADDWQPASVH